MALLKLIALDSEDLAAISANLQDAVVKAADIVYEPKSRRFVALVNRFDWEKALGNSGTSRRHERHRAALRFEKVRKVQSQNLKPGEADRVLSLLTITFEPAEAPAGHVTLVFADNVAIRLDVEFIEAELRDLGPSWRTRNRPDHPEPDLKATKPAGPGKTS